MLAHPERGQKGLTLSAPLRTFINLAHQCKFASVDTEMQKHLAL